jgi:hypothetical protein
VWQGAQRRGQLLYRRSCLVEGVTESLHNRLRHGAREVLAAMANSQPGPARTAAMPLGGRRGGREHVAHKERVGMAVQRGRSHGARTGGR